MLFGRTREYAPTVVVSVGAYSRVRPNNVSLLFSFLDTEAEAAEFLAEAVVFAVGVGEGAGMVELELAGGLVNQVLLGVDGHHVGDEHIMAAETLHLHHLALDVERAFLDEGRHYQLCRFGMEAHLAELVDIAAALYTAPVGGAGQLGGGEVDDELAGALDDGVAVAVGAHADIAHGRVTADSARPCDGDDVIVLGAVAAADHDGRQWVDHCPRLECCFHIMPL